MGFPDKRPVYTSLCSEPFRKDRTLIKTINLTQKNFKRNNCGQCADPSKMFIKAPLKTCVLTSQLSCTAEWTDECHPAFTLAQRQDGEKAGSIKVTDSLQVNCQVEVCRRDEQSVPRRIPSSKKLYSMVELCYCLCIINYLGLACPGAPFYRVLKH